MAEQSQEDKNPAEAQDAALRFAERILGSTFGRGPGSRPSNTKLVLGEVPGPLPVEIPLPEGSRGVRVSF